MRSLNTDTCAGAAWLEPAPRDTLAAILCAAAVRCRRWPPGAGAPAAALLLSACAAGVSFSRLLRLFSSLSTDLAPLWDLDLPLRRRTLSVTQEPRSVCLRT